MQNSDLRYYVDLARERGADDAVIIDDGFYKAFGLGCGFCTRCKVCDTTKHCVHPERMRPFMESCGIDVHRTARANGLPIEVVRSHDQEWDVYDLVLIE